MIDRQLYAYLFLHFKSFQFGFENDDMKHYKTIVTLTSGFQILFLTFLLDIISNTFILICVDNIFQISCRSEHKQMYQSIHEYIFIIFTVTK